MTEKRNGENPVFYEKGFYWVKIEDGIAGKGIHWEPAHYNGYGWGLCGQDPVLYETDFLEITKLNLPISFHEQERGE